MRRRIRRVREIPFSFDSFLDVVANVTGIIIRLILVVWVGARSYSTLQHLMSRPVRSQTEAVADAGRLEDTLEEELARQRRQLEEAQRQLLEKLRQLRQTADERVQVENQLTTL